MTTSNGRTADHPIASLFLDRWSPRSFSGEAIPDADLFTILEAARWAPSASNLQPWRFLYAKRDSVDWPRFFETLSPGNQGWVADTAVLMAVVSKRTRQPKEGPAVESYSHSFDTGAAWACLALQASLIGWAAHAMGGFDVARATRDLEVPDDYRVECMVAIGRYQADEANPAKPNARAPLTSLVREGVFRV
jgi:nitroreductase